MTNSLAYKQSIQAWINAGVIGLVVLLVTPIVLFVLGRGLGYLTLAIARRNASHQIFMVALDYLGRQLYRVLIILATVYFYLCIPLLVFGLITIICGNVQLALATAAPWKYKSDVDPIVIILAAGLLACFVPFLEVLRITGKIHTFTERRLSRLEAPQLFTLVNEVARQVHTRPIDSIYISPYPLLAVREIGNWRQKLSNSTERCLILGFGSLPDMTQGQFKALLAHEYGHFSNRDAIGGTWAGEVGGIIAKVLLAFHAETNRSRNKIWKWFSYLIYFLFKSYYEYIFMLVAIGAARLEEMMADRCAATAYNGKLFADALTHIVRQDLQFKVQVLKEGVTARKSQRNMNNLYSLEPLSAEIEQGVSLKFHESMNCTIGLYDAHLSPRDRIRLIGKINANNNLLTNDEPVWDLLTDVEGLQMEMTGVIQQVLDISGFLVLSLKLN